MSKDTPVTRTGFECRGVSKTYSTRSGAVHALSDASFRVADGEFVCIVGPSGCGKSTLLRLIAGLLTPDTGQIVSNAPNGGPPDTAMVFQEHGLFPWMSVLDNVAFGLEMRGVARDERQRRAREFIARVGLHQFANHYPHELSVGMRQRVGIARAFVANPPVLLMDEPFGALDAQTKLVLQEELLTLWRDDRKVVVYVTHDIEEAVLLGDRVLVMSGRPGRIREDITVPVPRPRNLADRDHPAVRDLKWHIWKALETDVRQSVGITL